MKISRNWLRDYIETELSAEEISEILSDLGFPCEGIEHLADDSVIDAEITSNRADCLGHIGVARELAAVLDKQLKMPVIELAESEKQVTEFTGVEIADPQLCGRYTARIIEGVKIGPSPDWMQQRLASIGIRSVNNVVDATNYAMAETAQPPHAFDYSKIAQGRITVRKAVLGEILVSIDESKCALSPDMLIIADSKGPVAIAGVMGGLNTEVTDTTTTILLEDAYFDPVCVRTTSRRLSLPSQASFRFERRVDIEMIEWASRRTAQLITQVAGGRVAKGVVDVYPQKPSPKQVTLRLGRLKKLLGIEVPRDEAMRILSALNFAPQLESDSLICCVPSWRNDIYREVDLIEEVARVYGYDKIPTEHKISIEVASVDGRQKMVESIGSYLSGCGFYETINVAFVDNSVAGLFTNSAAKEYLSVKDVSSRGANLLRQTLISSLLGVLKTNINAKNTPCRIYEIADTFAPSDSALPNEKTRLSLVCDGDLRELRGVVEGLVNDIDKTAETSFVPAQLPWAEAGAHIVVNGKVIGSAGIVSQKVKAKFDFKKTDPCAAELDFSEILALSSGPAKIKPIPRFPTIERDLSVIVAESVTWFDITKAVNEKSPNELEDVCFVGIFRGKSIAAGKKSVTLSLRFRDEDGTLVHETVDAFEKTIVDNLVRSTGAVLRTA